MGGGGGRRGGGVWGAPCHRRGWVEERMGLHPQAGYLQAACPGRVLPRTTCFRYSTSAATSPGPAGRCTNGVHAKCWPWALDGSAGQPQGAQSTADVGSPGSSPSTPTQHDTMSRKKRRRRTTGSCAHRRCRGLLFFIQLALQVVDAHAVRLQLARLQSGHVVHTCVGMPAARAGQALRHLPTSQVAGARG